MTPEEAKKLIGITPDTNEDYVDDSQITQELKAIYESLKGGQLLQEDSTISRRFTLVKKYKMLQQKKESDTLTEAERKMLRQLKARLGRI